MIVFVPRTDGASGSPSLKAERKWTAAAEGAEARKGRTLLMPLATFEEGSAISSALGTGMDDAALKERINVGGYEYVFRYIADDVGWTLEQLQRQVDAAVGRPTLYRIEDSLRAVKLDTDDDSCFVHVNVGRDALRTAGSSPAPGPSTSLRATTWTWCIRLRARQGSVG
jgi:hypothetical protein